MKKKNLVGAIKVASPCTEDWGEMTGNKKVRFCSHCDLNVNNLSEMTRTEAMRLVKKSDGKLCVRYVEHPVTKAPVFAERLYQIGRRAGIAAGVLGASLAASTIVYAQGGAIVNTTNLNEKSKTVSVIGDKNVDPKTDKTASIFGTMTDPQGAAIPNVEITLINQENEQKIVTRSNEAGVYEFKNVNPAVYNIEFYHDFFTGNTIENVKINSQDSVKYDASLEVKSMIMGSMIMVIERTAVESAILEGNAKLVQDFISRGLDVNAEENSSNGSTLLHLAVDEKNSAIIQILLNSGAKINAKDFSGNTVLMGIDEDTPPEIIRLLIRYGGNLNEKNDSGYTALMQAAYEENLGAVKVLLEAGADVNLRNDDDQTALDLSGNKEIENLLVSYGAIVVSDN